MAATRRNAMRIAEARVKIQTTQLVNRLTSHVLGKVDMQPSQVTAALGLLKKSLPDLGRTEVTGKDGGAITLEQFVAGSFGKDG